MKKQLVTLILFVMTTLPQTQAQNQGRCFYPVEILTMTVGFATLYDMGAGNTSINLEELNEKFMMLPDEFEKAKSYLPRTYGEGSFLEGNLFVCGDNDITKYMEFFRIYFGDALGKNFTQGYSDYLKRWEESRNQNTE